MNTFVKLYSSILTSSVWFENDQTLRVWITLLAMADKEGRVVGTEVSLAHAARVPREAAHEALRRLSAPDPDSRSQEYAGRRIGVVEGGWVLLNHGRYRDLRDAVDRRAYNREQKRKSRAASKASST